MKKLIRFLFLLLVVTLVSSVGAGECFLLLKPTKSGQRLRGRVFERGLASRSIDRETKAIVLKLPAQEKEQTTTIGFVAKSDLELTLAVAGRFESAKLNTKKKFVNWVFFSEVTANDKVLIGDGKGAKKPAPLAKELALPPPIKLKKGEKLFVKLTFNELSRQESREMTEQLLKKANQK